MSEQEKIIKEFFQTVVIDPRVVQILSRFSFIIATKKDKEITLEFATKNLLPITDVKFLDTYLSYNRNYHQEIDKISVILKSDFQVENIGILREYIRYFAEQIGKQAFFSLAINCCSGLDNDFAIVFEIDEKIFELHQDQLKKLAEKLKQYGCNNEIRYRLTAFDEIDLAAEDISEQLLPKEEDIAEPLAEVVEEEKVPQTKKVKNQFQGRIFEVTINETVRGIYAVIGITSEEESRYINCSDSNIDSDLLLSLQVDDIIAGDGKMHNGARGSRFYANSLKIIGRFNRVYSDDAENKRVELHVHTKMSSMDGVSDIADYAYAAKQMGHKAIAITDHGGVQGFPQAQTAGLENDIKIIYGMEAYMIDEIPPALIGTSDAELSNATYVVFDIETTGLSPEFDSIIEIGAVKIVQNVEEGIFKSFIKYDKQLSSFIKNLTKITEADLLNAPPLKEVLTQFLDFAKGAILVAHNARFDYNFISHNLIKLGLPPLNHPTIDTLSLSKQLLPTLGSYRLGSLCRHLDIMYNEEQAHRAQEDSSYLAQVLEVLIRLAINAGLRKINDLSSFIGQDLFRKVVPFHVSILVKNKEGLKNLYQIVSISSLKYFSQIPRIPRSELSRLREGLLLGSCCYNGEIFDLAQTASKAALIAAIKFYDYVELQPIDLYQPLVDLGKVSKSELKKMLRFIIDCAREAGVMIVATGDVHQVHPDDLLIRDIYVNSLSVGNVRHPLNDYNNKIKEIPNNYLRSTKQMIAGMSYLTEAEKEEIVITNSNLIADQCESITPFTDILYPPTIDDCDQKLTDLVYLHAHQKYGPNLPSIIADRIKKELDCIIEQKYAVIYYSAYLVVKKSLEIGYLVGSRGSVGSSLVATFAQITEVNPLPPHYVCPNCYYFELRNDVFNGFDLPDRPCPNCGMLLNGDGQDIPFETFLGFDEVKVPDIDLNFSSECQQIAHNYAKEIFGAENVFRAGTVMKIEDRKAYGYVRAYLENKGREDLAQDRAYVMALAKRCTGVKQSTGKHAGGIVVIPKDKVIEDFCPVQYPADSEGDIITTHIDYKALHDNILKLDLLGHIDPSVLRMLHQLTDIDPRTIRLNNKEIIELFTSLKPLNIVGEIPNWRIGIAGLPEFGTAFVRKMVEEIEPKSFSDIIKISGLSHGKGVWQNNIRNVVLAQKRDGDSDLSAIIGCRDDIMTYLISKNVEPGIAFKIMEAVRKGKGNKVLTADLSKTLIAQGIPEWYIECCLKINYLFPKAHASAYVMMAMRIAWYKINYPLEYYAAFFTYRVKHFDIETLMSGMEKTRHELSLLQRSGDKLSDKEEELVITYEIALEMFARGYQFGVIDIHKSDAVKFIIDKENKLLIPPFVSVEGLGAVVANIIVENRLNNPYMDSEDFVNRSGISKTLQNRFYELKIINEEDRRQMSFDLFTV